MKISKATRKQMVVTFTTTFSVFALILIPLWSGFREAWNAFPPLAATIAIVPLMFAMFPLVNQYSTERLAKYKAKQLRWREHYRTTPEANLLNLHD